MKIAWLAFLFLISFFVCGPLAAEEEEEAPKASIQYLELSPGIIANFGSESGKPKLLNADVTLQVNDEETADKVSKYLIPIRHDLIMLFSSLKSDEASTGAQVELLRSRALESVHASLEVWLKDTQVADLLFTKFVTE